MKPIRTTESNLTLTHPSGQNVPAMRALLGPNEETARPGFVTTWDLDDGERRAVANGAPIIMNLWGQAHPPVVLEVGEPGIAAVPLIAEGDAHAAAGRLYRLMLGEVSDEDGQRFHIARRQPNGMLVVHPLPVEAFLEMWQTAFDEVRKERASGDQASAA